MSLSTNITNNARRGYRDASMNRNELIWNAQIAQSFLKGNAATISFEIYDILKQQTNISRSLTADMRSVSEYNGVNSYCMLHFIYRLNIFGNKEARGNMRHGGFDGGGHGPRGGGNAAYAFLSHSKYRIVKSRCCDDELSPGLFVYPIIYFIFVVP